MKRIPTMRWTLPVIAALVGLLVGSTSAFAARAGHNAPTRTLEGAFKVAQLKRAGSEDGCYLAPRPLAAAIRKEGNIKADVAAGFKAVRRSGIVYVIKGKSRCSQLILAFRNKAGVWVLNSNSGDIRVQGSRGGRDKAEPGARGPLRALSMATKTLRLTRSDQTARGEVLCPRGKFPLGGGMISNPPLGSDGEGAYPHSYERLGAQRGWHVNPVLIDPSVLIDHNRNNVTPRSVTLQVICGKGLVPATGPRKTIFLKSGQTGTVKAKCPKGQYLMSGGFQRTNFKTPGGDYVTESRAISPRAWRVTGRAFGDFGGELTAIAYCDRSKRKLLTEVSAATPLPTGQYATATTPPCPRGRRLTSGGFSANGSHDTLFAGGSINPNRTWSASGFGYFGSAPSLTAYGYCLRVKGAK